MSILSVQNIGISFGETRLFDNLNLNINEKDKIGFIGSNGTGKTTLFNILTHNLVPENGYITKSTDCRIGYLQQHAPDSASITVLDQVLKVFDGLVLMEQELHEITNLLDKEDSRTDKLVLRYHSLFEDYKALGGLTYQSRAAAALKGLGFNEESLKLPIGALSGGEKTRVMLSSLILSSSNLLLLDEPTNHLDINAVTWLEDFLSSYNGAFIVISHDRYFLDRITNKTLELENKCFTMYNGNYTFHVAEKAKNQETRQNQYKNQLKEIKRIEGIIETQRRWNRERNIRAAESKQKHLDKLTNALVKPILRPEDISFNISPEYTSGNDVVRVEAVSFAYKEPLLTDINIDLHKGDRAFLLGPNGCGKTTLFDILCSKLTPKSGEIIFGTNVIISRYDQTQADLNHGNTVLDEIRNAHPSLNDTPIRNALAAFLIKGEDVFKKIAMLSGGERAKVSLLKIILSRPNLLLLDEPTNHLDIVSKEALENALLNYEGTMLVISHDRYFINKLANKIFYLDKGVTTLFDGNYDYFKSKKEDDITISTAPLKKPNLYKAEKAYFAAVRKIENQITKIENLIENSEEKLCGLKQELIEHATNYIKATETSKQIELTEKEISHLFSEWEKLSKELALLKAQES